MAQSSNSNSNKYFSNNSSSTNSNSSNSCFSSNRLKAIAKELLQEQQQKLANANRTRWLVNKLTHANVSRLKLRLGNSSKLQQTHLQRPQKRRPPTLPRNKLLKKGNDLKPQTSCVPIPCSPRSSVRTIKTSPVLVVGQDTPDIVRNLKGEPVFQKGATACLPFGTISADQNTIGWRFLVEVERKIERNGELVNSSLMLTACEPAAFADYDLIIFSRAQLSNATIEALTPLADALRKRQFVALATYKIAEFRASETARADSAHAEAARQEAERIDALKSFQTREPSVVSVIHTEAPASVVCIASSPDPDGVRYLLKRADAPFAGTISPDSAIRVIPSTDAIFIALKRKECTAAAAPAGALRDVMAGLMRDGFKVEVDKGVITTDQLAAWKVMSAQELATAQEQQARDLEARRKLEAQRAAQDEEARRLTEQRQRNDEIARSEELERMRKQVSSKANAVMDDFTKRLQRHITSVVNEVTETQQRARTGRVLTLQERSELQTKYAADRMDFEPWATQLVPLVKEGWEFGNLKPMVNDYGRAQWKQRTIEAITVRVEIPIVNRVIGDKRVICEDFTWINDEEFQFMRQPQAVSCADYERTYAEWSQANSFVSQWKLLPVQY